MVEVFFRSDIRRQQHSIPVVTEGIFKISQIVLIIGLTAGTVLIFLYPLNKVRRKQWRTCKTQEKIEKNVRETVWKTDHVNRKQRFI